MAAVVDGTGVSSSTNAATYATSGFTPAANELLVVIAAVTGEMSTDWVVTDSQSGTYTKIRRQVKATSADFVELWVRTALSAATSRTVTFSHASGNATGCALRVLRVSGMTRLGASAIRAQGGQDNQAASTTPAPALDQAALTGNPTVGAVFNATNPATMTEPTGWTENSDVGYGSPNTGVEVVRRDSGFTGTTVTWGGTSSAFASIIAELDTSAPSHTLVIQDATHAHVADNVNLAQVHALAIQDAVHGHTADTLSLTQTHVLQIADALHAHTADNVSLAVRHLLAIQDALHGHTADNVALVQHYLLVIQDALHLHTADNLVLTVQLGPTPRRSMTATLRRRGVSTIRTVAAGAYGEGVYGSEPWVDEVETDRRSSVSTPRRG